MNKKVLAHVEELEKKLATEWSGMPHGWTDASRKSFWENLVGNVKHKRTKCFERLAGKPGFHSEESRRRFCQSLWDDYENK